MSNTAEDLRAKSVDELSQLVLDLRKEQFNQRFQKSQGTLENTAQIRKNRREIARAKTILTQKRQDEAPKGTKKASGKKAA